MNDFRFDAWPTEHRQINQYFGANPHNYAHFGLPGHEGLDFQAPAGSKIFAVTGGTVSMVHTDPNSHNYGIHVRVKHDDGYESIYAHLQEAYVAQGDEVKAGDLLGLADNTGNSFGDHLHFVLKKEGARLGRWPSNIIDPTPYALPFLSWQEPAGPLVEGWVLSAAITVAGDLAQVNSGGVTFRYAPGRSTLVPEGTILVVAGAGRQGFTPVKVPQATLDTAALLPPTAAAAPLPTEATSDGWASLQQIAVTGARAFASLHGVDLRLSPLRHAPILGLVRSGSALSILGPERSGFLPVRARRADFVESIQAAAPPGNGSAVSTDAPPTTVADAYTGWVQSASLSLNGHTATNGATPAASVVQRTGANLLNQPHHSADKIGLVRGFATVTISGLTKANFVPVLVRKEDVLNVARPMPPVETPIPLPNGVIPLPPAPPAIQDTTPGWALTTELTIAAHQVLTGAYGLNLRSAPRRDAANLGFVQPRAAIIVTGPPRGEFTPIRVQEPDLLDSDEAATAEPAILGRARIGLHASTDPAISEAEHQEFAALRPGIIKLLSFHDAPAVARLAAAHPDAIWIVRAFLSFGGRTITPEQFLRDTVGDVKRALDQLRGKEVVVELHNEPNLVNEGLGSSWSDGASFGAWWLDCLARYRHTLPDARFIYPGLSPGSTVNGVKQDHIQFIEASRAAVQAADGLGVHLYWSNVYPLSQSLRVLDDYISRFRAKPIWVTEASHNKGGAAAGEKTRQYLQFWGELQKRPTVRGVTFFVASSSNPALAEEVWLGRGIAAIIGRR